MKLLYSEKEVDQAYDRLAEQLNKYSEDNTVLVSILKGGAYSLFQLLERVDKDFDYGFMQYSSYHQSTIRACDPKLTYIDIPPDSPNKKIILIDDILDTGSTINTAIKYLLTNRKCKSVEVMTLLKRLREDVVISSNFYYGLEFDSNQFVVGCGLNYKNKYRSLKELYLLDKKDIK